MFAGRRSDGKDEERCFVSLCILGRNDCRTELCGDCSGFEVHEND